MIETIIFRLYLVMLLVIFSCMVIAMINFDITVFGYRIYTYTNHIDSFIYVGRVDKDGN